MGILRLYLAICVFLFHASQPTHHFLLGGYSAVYSFFIISGFYIAMVLETKYLKSAGLAAFYTNRALRLFPAYWAVLILGCVLHLCGLPFGDAKEITPPYIGLKWGLKIADNFLILPGALYFGLLGQPIKLPEFLGRDVLIYGQCFTIGLELIFYLSAPLIVRQSTQKLAIFFMVFLTIHFMPSIVFHIMDIPDNPRAWQYEFPPATFVFFVGGCLSYRFYKFISQLRYPHKLGWIFLLLVPIAAELSGDATFHNYTNSFAAALVYLLIAAGIPFLFNASRNVKIDRMLGDASYPIYINHFLAFYIKQFFLPGWTALSISLMAVISVVLAALSLCFIEWPIDKLREKIGSSRAITQRSAAHERSRKDRQLTSDHA